MQAPEVGQVSSQLPAEQSVVQGEDAQAAVQLPDEQAHVPPVHGVVLREEAVPGSEIAGPPLGLPVVVVVLEPPHAAIVEIPSTSVTKSVRIIKHHPSLWIARCTAQPFKVMKRKARRRRSSAQAHLATSSSTSARRDSATSSRSPPAPAPLRNYSVLKSTLAWVPSQNGFCDD